MEEMPGLEVGLRFLHGITLGLEFGLALPIELAVGLRIRARCLSSTTMLPLQSAVSRFFM